MIGQKLSHYRIIEKLGAGGMGEVYRAEDQNLGRTVAIKVLPDVFAGDPERLARFEREAKLLASLSHPNIAAIYGLEASGGKQFLVLELVEGETLAERLIRGALPFEDALETCLQIAAGLEGAHEKGIVHRDLKPSNIKVSPEGKVKILDFGLAKAFLGQTSTTDIAHSPTITAEMTRPGVVLGTASYMSPEQAKGKPVDKRADIWAFGCVLFECLAGKRAFRGESVTEVIARIIEAEPEWDLLPKNIPPFIRALLRRCLQKDRNRRLHDMADVRIEIEEGLAAPIEVAPAAAPKVRRWTAPLLVFSLIAIAAVAGLWLAKQRQRAQPGPVGRFAINIPASSTYAFGGGLALSPDGSLLVFAAHNRLYLRKMDSFETSPISGTEGFRSYNAAAPVFSPDGNWIAFFADYKLWKISVWGGGASFLGDWGGTPYGASWSDEGSIIYGRGEMGIWKVPAAGGEAKLLIAPDPEKKEVFHGPQLIKNGEWVLFTLGTLDASWDSAEIAVQSLKTGERKSLIRGGKDGRYVPTGHLVYARGQRLMAARFDLNRLEVLGNSVEVSDDLTQDPIYPFSRTSISQNGTYVYIHTEYYVGKRELVWTDRKGRITPAAGDQQSFGYLGLSPNGHRAAVSIAKEGGGYDIWIYDLTGKSAPLRLTYRGCNWDPVWTPDGQGIVYSAAPTCRSTDDLYFIPADGSSRQPRLLLDRANRQYPYSFDPAGNLLFCDFQSQKGWDVYVLDMKGKREARPLLDSEYTEWHPVVSPNGRWIAYASSESGSEEVYVASYPDLKAKKRISFEGGREPRWSQGGVELFYRNRNQIMAVALEPGQEFRHLPPVRLFAGNFWGQESWPTYHVAPDGRFLLIQQEAIDQETGSQINVVINWFEELRKKAERAK